MRRYTTVSLIESIVEDLHCLSEVERAKVARFVGKLAEGEDAREDSRHGEQVRMLRASHGVVTDEQAQRWLKAVDDCRPIDPL